MFCCGKVRRVKDERGRRDWTRENGMRWNSWEALACKKWVRMEDSGRVDDEGRPILEGVDLMETFFVGVHRQMCVWVSDWFGEAGARPMASP